MGRYLETEEGLATWLEERHGVLDSATVQRYALRFLAVVEAEHAGWTAVTRLLLAWTSPGEAFDIAARVKRGMTDTSAPGGWLKDHVYWTGYHLVRERLAMDPSLLALLETGKFGLHQLEH
jgi:hypothetical protein